MAWGAGRQYVRRGRWLFDGFRQRHGSLCRRFLCRPMSVDWRPVFHRLGRLRIRYQGNVHRARRLAIRSAADHVSAGLLGAFNLVAVAEIECPGRRNQKNRRYRRMCHAGHDDCRRPSLPCRARLCERLDRHHAKFGAGAWASSWDGADFLHVAERKLPRPACQIKIICPRRQEAGQRRCKCVSCECGLQSHCLLRPRRRCRSWSRSSVHACKLPAGCRCRRIRSRC